MTDNPQLESWKLNHEATVASGTAAIRTVLLINGGAAAAVLAFIGGVASQGRISTADINQIASGLTWFGYGVFAATSAMGLAYLTNRAILKTVISPVKIWNLTSAFSQIITIVVFLISLALFLAGLFAVREAIGSMKFIEPAKQTTTCQQCQQPNILPSNGE